MDGLFGVLAAIGVIVLPIALAWWLLQSRQHRRPKPPGADRRRGKMTP